MYRITAFLSDRFIEERVPSNCVHWKHEYRVAAAILIMRNYATIQKRNES